jgi:hypothetical protein
MKIRLDEGGRLLGTISPASYIHLRVNEGHVHIGKNQQEVQSQEGISIYPSDGFLSIFWDRGPLWVAGGERDSQLEIILP